MIDDLSSNVWINLAPKKIIQIKYPLNNKNIGKQNVLNNKKNKKK
jgi:hypothetical protein